VEEEEDHVRVARKGGNVIHNCCLYPVIPRGVGTREERQAEP
jgi:hypothetical protein